MERHEMTDGQWALVEPPIPRSDATTGRPANDPRRMLDGIFWILATGAPWRDLPRDRFGPYQSVHRYLGEWRDAGVFAAVAGALRGELDALGLLDFELWCVDGASVRATRAAAGAQKKAPNDTPASRPTTRWAAAGAGSAPSSTSSPTAAARRWPSRSRPARSTSRPAPSR